MKQKVIVMRALQSVGGTLHVPVVALPPDQLTVQKVLQESSRELSDILRMLIVTKGQDGRPQPVMTVEEFLQQFFGMTGCGHAPVSVGETDGGPQIILPNSGIIR